MNSESRSNTEIDIANASTRLKKQLVIKEISKLLQETNDFNEVVTAVLEQYPAIFSKDQLEKEVRKIQTGQKSTMSMDASIDAVTSQILIQQQIHQPQSSKQTKLLQSSKPTNQNGTPIPKPVPKNAITNFLIAPEMNLKNQVNSLTQQVSDLKQIKIQLEQQLQATKIETNQSNLINKIKMALTIHEYEAQEICQKYKTSKVYERYKTNDGSITYNQQELQQQLLQIDLQMKKIEDQLDNKLPSKYTLTLQYNDLAIRHQQITTELEQATSLTELNMINQRIFTNLKEKCKFKDFLLPCFYPTHEFMAHPLNSQGKIQIPAVMPKFVLVRLIGEGGFSKVYKAFNLSTCEFIALKISTFDAANENKWKLISREAKIYQDLDHPNIVKLFQRPLIIKRETADQTGFQTNVNINSANQASEIALEMELCDDQSLFDFVCIQTHRVMGTKERELNEKLLIGIFYQIADALKYLHENKLTHNDISLSNILKKGAVWKLSDFSLAKEVAEDITEQHNVTTLGTTRPFAPPEKVLQRKFSSASDMYSFGVVMFVSTIGSLRMFEEIGTGFTKRVQVNPADSVRDYFQMNQPIVCTLSDEMKELIISLVDIDFAKRPSAAQVCDILEKFLKRSVKKQRK
ncbi:Kinase [Hexamita inflata]|uniref:CAMK CAMK-Unique n=1 Tax=Hexamita inflata TaxID=28002 RepID=A0AA86UVB9_9EUKA|nr:CAMK CAMK-Unique [Hexamita inflata]CAI9972041.1 CAMK CAMK-Unique [Hexamita inflata]